MARNENFNFLLMCTVPVPVHTDSDEEAVKALKVLRLTADDFEVKGVIGRGHFGEVSYFQLHLFCIK